MMYSKNITGERGAIMNAHIMNALSGAIMSPIVDKLCKKVSTDEIKNLHISLEFMKENEMTQEAFAVLHIIIKTSGVGIPSEFQCIVDNENLQAGFIEEAIAELEDILYDLE